MTRAGRSLFVATILAGSFLLFLVQPMVARLALPRLGGTPAVWNSAMLIYQALLLGGYAWAHALARLSPRRQAAAQLALLAVAALWLPLGLVTWTPPANGEPALWVPLLLGGSIAPLFLAVSAQAPLVQRWFAAASGGEDPYRLYAASNLGSFAGLLAYPLLVEPLLRLDTQRFMWSAGYVALFALVALLAWRLPRTAATTEPAATSPPAGGRRVLRWIALAFVPSALMLATSSYISTDVVAMPLLWVIPLGLYLLSFVVAFAANRAPADLLTRVAPITILLFGGVLMGGYQGKPYLSAGVALTLLFMAAVAIHTQLYRERPEPDRLTGFYLAMSAGGALGGIFTGLLAPVLFDWTWEFPLLVAAAGLIAPQVFLTHGLRGIWMGDPTRRLVAFSLLVFVAALLLVARLLGPADLLGGNFEGAAFIVLAALGLASIGARLPYMVVLLTSLALFGGLRAAALSWEGNARTRSYFGVYSISQQPDRRSLSHGTTLHGLQLTGTPERERTPTTYYARGSGVGQAMALAPALYGARARIGVVGLGTGTLACYARPGQQWRFYEIDRAVVGIAERQFSFLRRCLPNPTIVMGDARLSIAAAAPGSLDLLALDAFSSDAVPMHLLTQEAFAHYARVLSPRGLLLVHISNRFLDLEPVVAAAAQAGGWSGARLNYDPSTLDDAASGSLWIALSRDPASIAALRQRDPSWEDVRRRVGFAPWSDDYSTILPLLK